MIERLVQWAHGLLVREERKRGVKHDPYCKLCAREVERAAQEILRE